MERFLLTGPGRTGSTMLLHMLAVHSDVCMHGEVFTWNPEIIGGLVGLEHGGETKRDKPLPLVSKMIQERNRDPAGFLGDYVYCNNGYYTHIGVNIKFEELGLRRYRNLRKTIEHDKDIKVIIMKRQNWLRRKVSVEAALSRGREYNRIEGQQAPEDVRVSISPSDMRQERKRIAAWNEEFKQAFREHETMWVEYSDLACDPQGVSDRVQTFLGLPQRSLPTRTVKMTPGPLSDLIENYSEVEKELKGTADEPLLHE